MSLKVLFTTSLLLQSFILSSCIRHANVIVAKDGSGKYKTISEAVKEAPKWSSTRNRFVVWIKAGIYEEYVYVKETNVLLTGDGIGKTIITGNKSKVKGGFEIDRSATLTVTGKGFVAEYLAIRNTAGPANQQEVAIYSNSYHSAFYKCNIEGFEDTKYAVADQQLYRECDIYRTVDFIFGDVAIVLQKCNIFLWNPPSKTNVITAQGRTQSYKNSGISIHDSLVTAAGDLIGVSGVQNYLGRPWKNYSRTVFMKTNMDVWIEPAGWMEWNGSKFLDTLYYGEYKSYGLGSSTRKRVTWRGYIKAMTTIMPYNLLSKNSSTVILGYQPSEFHINRAFKYSCIVLYLSFENCSVC
ncbi:hypothetical protein ACFE04_013795 [Oxalis oulophora]